MKTLYNYIYEGILDIDDDDLDIFAHRKALEVDLKNHQGEIYDYFHQSKCNNISIANDGIIYINGDCNLPYTLTQEPNEKFKELHDMGVITGISCDKFQGGGNITSDTVGDNIICKNLLLSKPEHIKDININIKNVLATIDYPFECNFDNVNIEFDNYSHYNKIHINGLVDLSGLKSNAIEVDFYMVTDLDEWNDELSKIFDFGHTCKIHDKQKDVDIDIPIKNFSKAIAVVNNKKRYALLSHIVPLKSNAKLKDMFPVDNFENLKCLTLRNNNIKLRFIHEDEMRKRKIISFSRHPGTADKTNTDDIYLKTKDGWYVVWVKD